MVMAKTAATAEKRHGGVLLPGASKPCRDRGGQGFGHEVVDACRPLYTTSGPVSFKVRRRPCGHGG